MQNPNFTAKPQRAQRKKQKLKWLDIKKYHINFKNQPKQIWIKNI